MDVGIDGSVQIILRGGGEKEGGGVTSATSRKGRNRNIQHINVQSQLKPWRRRCAEFLLVQPGNFDP